MEDEDPMDVFQQQKEMSTEKGGRYFIPEFCYKPRNILLWKAAARLPHTLTTTLFSALSFPCPYSFLEHKVPGVLRQHVAVFPFGWHQMEKGWEGSGSMKPPLSPLVARSLSPSLYSTGSYFALIVLTKELNNINPCTPSSVGECQCFSFITKPRTICKLPLCSCYM